MITYILESGICMTVSLICYSTLFGRGKYLQFNRGYLLFTLMLSVSIPFLEVETAYSYSYFDDSHFNLDSGGTLATDHGSEQKELSASAFGKNSIFQLRTMLLWVYLSGVLFMLYRFVKNLLTLRKLAVNSEHVEKESYKIVLINKATGPFSFMNWIFVNKSDYQKNKIHETIWSHELSHVRQCHSLDILLIELLLVVFYFNPLLWIYRYAIKLNHEYAADENVIKAYPDIETYAYQIIQFTHSKSNMLFECTFNFVSTKKRLMMLTKSKISKVLFGNRIAFVMLLVFATAAMLSFKHIKKTNTPIADENQIVVVIDLGHGGKDGGAASLDGKVKEVEIIDAIGSMIRKMDTQVRFIYTREEENVSLQDRAELAGAKKAGLLLSIHIGASDNVQASGLEVFYSDSNPAADKSKHISEVFAEKLVFRKGSASNKVRTANFVVLKESTCPSVLLTLGFISNKADLDYLMDERNQKGLAEQIVGILDQLN